MSAYTKIKTQLTDQELLVYSLKAMGYDPSVYTVGQQLIGWAGHKNPKATVVVPREKIRAMGQHISSDLGFAKDKDGAYQFFVNDMDQRRFGEEWMEELKLNYNVGVAMRKAQTAGIKNVARKEHTVAGKKHVQLVFA